MCCFHQLDSKNWFYLASIITFQMEKDTINYMKYKMGLEILKGINRHNLNILWNRDANLYKKYHYK